MGNEISIDISGIKASSRNTWILRGFITFCAVLSLVMGISSGFKLGTGVTAVLPGALIGGFLFQFLLRKRNLRSSAMWHFWWLLQRLVLQ